MHGRKVSLSIGYAKEKKGREEIKGTIS